MASSNSYILNNLGFQLLHAIDPKEQVSISPLALLGPLSFLLKSTSNTNVPSAIDHLIGLKSDQSKLTPCQKADLITELANQIVDGDKEFIHINLTNGICLPQAAECQNSLDLKKHHLLVEQGAAGIKQANTLIEQASDNQLKQLIHSNDHTASLFSSIYLKAPWCNLFRPDSTKKTKFHVDSNHSVDIDMMSHGSMLTFNDDKAIGVRMMKQSFMGCNYDIVVMVPSKKFGLAEMEKKLTGDKFLHLLQTGRTVMGAVKIPRINLDGHLELKSALEKAGLADIFDQAKSQLTHAVKAGVHLSSVVHGVSVHLNEFGSNLPTRELKEYEMMMSCMGGFTEMPEQQDVVADEPFLLAVVCSKDSALVSIHRVLHPIAA